MVKDLGKSLNWSFDIWVTSLKNDLKKKYIKKIKSSVCHRLIKDVNMTILINLHFFFKKF